MSTKYIVENIFVVFLSLLNSQLSNSIDLKKCNFLMLVIHKMKKYAADSERLKSCKTTRLRLNAMLQ